LVLQNAQNTILLKSTTGYVNDDFQFISTLPSGMRQGMFRLHNTLGQNAMKIGLGGAGAGGGAFLGNKSVTAHVSSSASAVSKRISGK
jgi:hypothetical protein